MRKNKGLFFVVATLLAVTCLLVSCNSEVSDNASGDKGLAYITFDGGNSKRISESSVTQNYELVDINELYWVYSATKADLGGASGETTGARINNTTGLSGVIGGFSKGLWNFTLTGWKYDGEGGNPSTDVPTDDNENYEKIFFGEANGVILNTGTQLNPDPINVIVNFVPTGTGTLVIDSGFVFQWQKDTANTTGNLGDHLRLRIAVEGITNPYEYSLGRITETNEVVYKLDSDKVIDEIPAGDYVVTASVIETLGEVPTEDTTFVYSKIENINVKIYSGQTTRITAEMLEGEFAAGQFNAIIESVDTQTVTASVPVTFTSSYTPASATSGNVDASAITTVEFEADALEATGVDESYKLTVAVSDFATAQSKFVVAGGTSAASLDLDLKKYTGSSAGESITKFAEGTKFAVITSYIAKGLSGVSVVYNGVNQDDYKVDAGNGLKTDLTIPAKAIDSDSGLGYNSNTGYLSFKTNHFSEYYVSADAVEAINVRTNTVNTLVSTINGASDGDTVMLLKDVSYTSDSIEITKGITLQGNGHTITNTRDASASALNDNKDNRDAAVYLNNKGKTVTITNLKITTTKIGFIYVGTPDDNGTKADGGTININNCIFTTSGQKYGFFVNNYVNSLTVNIDGSELKAWAAIYAKSKHSTYTVKKSILTGMNAASSSPSNAFGTIVFESPAGISDSGDNHNNITIKDSTINALPIKNAEEWLCLQYGAHDNTVTVTNTSIKGTDGQELSDKRWETVHSNTNYTDSDYSETDWQHWKCNNTVTIDGIEIACFHGTHD